MKYRKADLQDLVSTHCQHLSGKNEKALSLLLLKFQMQLNGNVGNWDIKPLKFQSSPGVYLTIENFPFSTGTDGYFQCIEW